MGGVIDLAAETAALTGGVRTAAEEQKAIVARLQDEVAEIDRVAELLREVPKRLSHRVMVPFGPAAFFPGRLVRTNECMVKLGESHMVECTAHQAGEVLARRKARLAAQTGAAQQELRQAEARLQGAAGQLAADSQEGVLEIVESYDPATHGPLASDRPAASAHKPAVPAGRPAAAAADEELFRRMAELEAEEAAAEAGPSSTAAGKAAAKPLARGFFDRPRPPKPPGPPAQSRSSSGAGVLKGVVERQPAEPSVGPAAAAGGKPQAAAAPKKVSRFKQQRLAGQQG